MPTSALDYFPCRCGVAEAVKRSSWTASTSSPEYDRVVRSPSFEMRLPSVVSLKESSRRAAPAGLHPVQTCSCATASAASCGEHLPTHELTFDNLVPRSRGGRTCWKTRETACQYCNLLKGSRCRTRPRMFPRHGRRSDTYVLQENGRGFPPNTCTRAGATSLLGYGTGAELSRVALKVPHLICHPAKAGVQGSD